jgi:gluconate 2-dehydrogenase subunit 3-like protein
MSDQRDDIRSAYVGYDVLAKWSSPDWDDQTRDVVRRRVADVPPLRFLTAIEARTLACVADRVIPQPERARADAVPIVPWIDEKLAEDRRDGYRYDGMPPQRDAWRLGLAGIEEASRALLGRGFADLTPREQDDVLRRVEHGDPPGAAWEHVPARRFFRDVLCLTVVKTYYAHPAAWSEIGYSGPSAVRGHVRNWMGGVDPWDATEAGAQP